MSLSRPVTISLDIPADHTQLRIVSACIAELLANVEQIVDRDVLLYNVQLAVHEVCTNIIDHAYKGADQERIALVFTLEPPRRLIAEIRDTGHSFDLGTVDAPDLSLPRDRGYGLFLVRHLMDDVVYLPTTSGNCWRLIKHL